MKQLNFKKIFCAAFILALVSANFALAAPRDVQIIEVNLEAGIVELQNLGRENESLNGWRFCSHNSRFVRRYSAASGLNGISLSSGASLFVHFNNDASELASNQINISEIGGNFAALEAAAYGLQIYFPPTPTGSISFGNENLIADHLQWSINGVDNATADDRSDEAEEGGVWADQSDWISIAADTDIIRLTDLSNAELHSPANFALGAGPESGPRDIQITEVNLETGVVELQNLGTGFEPLIGWRFCSHNTNFVRRYSAASGLNGRALAPGASLFVHFNNDASASNEINISEIGGNFAALEAGAYGLQIYFPPTPTSGISFGNENLIADHLQWSINGVDNTTADDRSDEAQEGGVWVNQSDWISIAADTDVIRLTDFSNTVLHSPANYALGAVLDDRINAVIPIIISTLFAE